jgi:dephospho-CoA kinase
MFAGLGAHVAKADEIAHRLMQPGQAAYEAVVERFGRGILDPDGAINRPKLAALAFAPDHPRVQELNQLVHPAVLAEQDRWCEAVRREEPEGLAVIEAALILEAGARGRFDRLVAVTCHPEQKVERLAARLGISLEAAQCEVARRSLAQWPDEDKVRAADFVIYNTGLLQETARQVERLFRELKKA